PANLIDAEIGMRAITETHRGRSAADLLHRDHVLEIAHGGAAIGLFHGNPKEAEISEPRPEVARKLVRPVDLACAGGDLGRCELADTPAQHVRRFAEVEVQGRQGIGEHGWYSGAGSATPLYSTERMVGPPPLTVSFSCSATTEDARKSVVFKPRDRAHDCRQRAHSARGRHTSVGACISGISRGRAIRHSACG